MKIRTLSYHDEAISNIMKILGSIKIQGFEDAEKLIEVKRILSLPLKDGELEWGTKEQE